ncbi:MAG: PKD domain-containing protein [Acidobacteriota bacterium]
MKRLIALAAAVLVAGCSMQKQTAPGLTGPSELGLSIGVTATPDIITQDGQSQATITVTARDAASQPMSGVTIRAEITVGGTPVDFGTLSSKIVSTSSDGRATLTYRAPAAPPPTADSDAFVQILITPVGSNYAGTYQRDVVIRLARPGVIIPPGDGPQASFIFSPSTPREEDDIFFDGSGSTGNIVSYTWNFGDGRSETNGGPTARHRFGLAGTYSVTLTVKDDLGRTSTSAAKSVNVSSISAPTAAFAVSPTTPKAGENVFFNGSASKAAAGRTIVEYRWDFGDGTPLQVNNQPQAIHPFAGSATATVSYVVVLTVKDDTGRTATVSNTVAVAKPGP